MGSNTDFADAGTNTGVDPNHPCKNPNIRIVDADKGLIEGTRAKLAIVGYASSTRDMAPFGDPDYDIAGLNQIYRFLPREDIHMDIHVNWFEENVDGTDHKGWLAACGIPVLMSTRDPEIPTAVTFPLDAAIALGCDYFTSTISFYIAWGILQGYQQIDLYGVDLIVGTEYEFQKACAEFWLGVAHGKGVHLNIPWQSALLKHTHRYGYQREPAVGLIGLSEFQARIAGLTGERDSQLAKLHAIDGAINAVGASEKWIADPAKHAAWLQEQRGATMALLATIDGAIQEAQYTHGLLQMRSRGGVYQLVAPK